MTNKGDDWKLQKLLMGKMKVSYANGQAIGIDDLEWLRSPEGLASIERLIIKHKENAATYEADVAASNAAMMEEMEKEMRP
jgi:hypothetical protein